eukprot:scaffold3147_cov110-Isochrysis_galbana.AAC.3
MPACSGVQVHAYNLIAWCCLRLRSLRPHLSSRPASNGRWRREAHWGPHRLDDPWPCRLNVLSCRGIHHAPRTRLAPCINLQLAYAYPDDGLVYLLSSRHPGPAQGAAARIEKLTIMLLVRSRGKRSSLFFWMKKTLFPPPGAVCLKRV